jgi:hypothetical protein
MFVVLGMLLVPTNGLAVADDNEYQFVIDTLAETRGITVTPAELEAALVAEKVAPVTGAFQAFMNWETLEISIGAVTDTSGESGCVQGAFVGAFTVSPIGAPCMAYQAHPGGVSGQTLVSVGGSGVSIDALNLANFFDLILFSCTTNAGAGDVDWTTLTGQAVNAQCFAFNFGFIEFNPANYGSYDSITGGNGQVNIGLNNY